MHQPKIALITAVKYTIFLLIIFSYRWNEKINYLCPLILKLYSLQKCIIHKIINAFQVLNITETSLKERKKKNQSYRTQNSFKLIAESTPQGDHASTLHKSTKDTRHGKILKVESRNAQYVLLERVYRELGVVDTHSIDYAYAPVLLVPQLENDKGKVTHNHQNMNVDSAPNVNCGDDTFQGCLITTETFHETYEKVENNAFAGGSHGEIWRGRRHCGVFFGNRTASATVCKDDQMLILKRLRIEAGVEVLEAGLREVYFGKLLREEKESFTSYIDHFFLEKKNTPELWIVFRDAGDSLKSYLYTAMMSNSFVIYEQSEFWRTLRMSFASGTKFSTFGGAVLSRMTPIRKQHQNEYWVSEGGFLMKEVLRQLLSSAALLHEKNIVHRDIKPSNIICKTRNNADGEIVSVKCVLGDFSSAFNQYASENIYSNGPSPKEQTNEYAPPEVLFGGGTGWIPFDRGYPFSYDSWSIGVVALEMLLGTPNVFSVDQRTRAILTSRLKREGASDNDIQRALYLAALSQFCIYIPVEMEGGKKWPLRAGDPLHDASITKPTCTLDDFHNALQARDPLGLGFDDSSNTLLELIWELLAWNPADRISPKHALNHRYFRDMEIINTPVVNPNVLTSQIFINPQKITKDDDEVVASFMCTKCGKSFDNWNSCHKHTTSRKHGKFCDFDRTRLEPCLNAHSMLPAHPSSGYCDIQGRRKTIEDFHSIHLHDNYQLYGVYDGHWGNLASKYAASKMHLQLKKHLLNHKIDIMTKSNWMELVTGKVRNAFHDVHEGFLEVVKKSPFMDKSGTTATILLVEEDIVIVANVGDSRAILSKNASLNRANNNHNHNSEGSLSSAIQLTVDHIASNKDEKKYVEQNGGYISSRSSGGVGGIDRVNGKLAITRSIGNVDMMSVLSRSPHVWLMTKKELLNLCNDDDENGHRPEDENSICFVVLATDGLWDVVSNDEAAEMVLQVLKNHLNKKEGNIDVGGREESAFQIAAQRLTQEAYVRGSTDNIGVCVVGIS